MTQYFNAQTLSSVVKTNVTPEFKSRSQTLTSTFHCDYNLDEQSNLKIHGAIKFQTMKRQKFGNKFKNEKASQ